MQVATSTLPSFPRFRLALAGRRLTSMSWTDSPIVDALCCHPSNSVWPLRSRSERRPARGVSHVDTNLWHSLPLERRPRSCCSAPPPSFSRLGLPTLSRCVPAGGLRSIAFAVVPGKSCPEPPARGRTTVQLPLSRCAASRRERRHRSLESTSLTSSHQ